MTVEIWTHSAGKCRKLLAFNYMLYMLNPSFPAVSTNMVFALGLISEVLKCASCCSVTVKKLTLFLQEEKSVNLEPFAIF